MRSKKKIKESHLTKYLKDECKVGKVLCWKISDRFAVGRPDFMLVYRGRVVFVELKAPGKKATRMQEHVGKKLKEQGVEWYCLDSYEGIDLLMSDVLGGD